MGLDSTGSKTRANKHHTRSGLVVLEGNWPMMTPQMVLQPYVTPFGVKSGLIRPTITDFIRGRYRGTTGPYE